MVTEKYKKHQWIRKENKKHTQQNLIRSEYKKLATNDRSTYQYTNIPTMIKLNFLEKAFSLE